MRNDPPRTWGDKRKHDFTRYNTSEVIDPVLTESHRGAESSVLRAM